MRTTTRHRSWTWQAASLLLAYPDERVAERTALAARVAAAVPGPLGGPLRRTITHLDRTPLVDLQADYVATFDARRRHSLFLTYFAHGDTRRRGVALLRFKQTYLASGFRPVEDELPDHLCVVLEYAGTIDADGGRRLLLDHRAGLEVLRLGLEDGGSPWAGAVAAVSATLPPLGADERAAIARLAADGPPQEEVGLEPYAVPGGPVPLPTPVFPGGR